MIGVTEPRRVAAIAMSQRVAKELNLSTRLDICSFISVCTCVCVCVCVCVCMHAHTHICMFVHLCIWCVRVCVHVYIHTVHNCNIYMFCVQTVLACF